jgi:hypothetical protein
MANPSYYFTLFKKFQVIDHVPETSFHGSASPPGGFDLRNPNAVFGSSSKGPFLGGTTNPGDSPLWAILNAKATNFATTSVTVGGKPWSAMPVSQTPAWNDFQANASAPNRVVDVFGKWINAGKPNDVPNGVIASIPQVPIKKLVPGVAPFVCSMPNDTGDRGPGSAPVPNTFWSTSLIFLVDPANGNSVSPSSLTDNQEYYLAAVIGNRGQDNAGKYNSPTATEIDAVGTVMVWNTVDSPGVELPSLSNLDVDTETPIYEQYFLNSGHYDVVGFRLNVQNVYNGIIKALNDAVTNNGLDLAGLTPDQWVKAQPAHLCAKVGVRQQGQNFPNVGDSPVTNARLAQKNLAPFEVNLAVTEPDPNISWKNFIVGDPLFLKLGEGKGRNTLVLETKLPTESFRVFIAVPKATFERFFRGRREGAVKGFKVVDPHELGAGRLGERAKPFPEAVLLQYLGRENALEIPPLSEGLYLGMSLGIEYSVKRLKAGALGEVTLVHKALIPKHVPEQITAGGFTILVEATDHRKAP